MDKDNNMAPITQIIINVTSRMKQWQAIQIVK